MSSHLARLEALLFVAGEDGLSLRTMAQLLEIPVTGLTQSLEKLQAKYEADEDTALCLLESSNTYKIVTKPDFACLLRDYSKTPIPVVLLPSFRLLVSFERLVKRMLWVVPTYMRQLIISWII